MPAIADPYAGRPYDDPADAPRRAAPLRLHLRTALHRRELTRALADGADPATRLELTLRAAQLTSRRERGVLARTLRRTVAEAHGPAATRSPVVLICRRAVRDAESAITALIDRLEGPMPVRAQGMALIEQLVTDADRSPLYNDGEPGALRSATTWAAVALEPSQSHFHEFRVGV